MGKKSKHRHAMKMRVFHVKDIIYIRWREFLDSRFVESVDGYIPIRNILDKSGLYRVIIRF
jgi:hypothetical protein